MIDVDHLVRHALPNGTAAERTLLNGRLREAVALALEDLIARHSETLEFPEHPDCDYIETYAVRAEIARYRQEPKETSHD